MGRPGPRVLARHTGAQPSAGLYTGCLGEVLLPTSLLRLCPLVSSQLQNHEGPSLFSQSPQLALCQATFLFWGDLGQLATPWECHPRVSIHASQPWLPHAGYWAHLHAQEMVLLCRGSRCCPGPPLSALPPEGPGRSRHPARVQRGRLSAAVLAVVCVDSCCDPGARGLGPVLKPTPLQPCRAGPNAPLPWVRACVQVLDPKSKWRSKILLGLNFYGMDYSASKDAREPIIGAR